MGYKFLGNVIIKGKIKVLTGLHIGGAKDTYEIGGLDNPVIRTVDNEPYIPGSSLKGRLRSLLEWKEGEVPPNGDPTKGNPDHPIGRIFGVAASEGHGFGPTRLVVRDAYLSQETKEELKDRIDYTELKYENVINRITSRSQNLRQMERVPAGAKFDFSMVYSIYEIEQTEDQAGNIDDVQNLRYVFEAMALLEDSYLGGSGTRGYGKVKFEDIQVIVRPARYYSGEKEEKLVEKIENVRLSKQKRDELVKKIKEELGIEQ